MAQERKNRRVRATLAEYGKTQEWLAYIYGVSATTISIQMQKEWSDEEQNEVIEKIKQEVAWEV